VEDGKWRFANHPPAEIQISNLLNPDWILDFGYWKVEGGSLTTRLLKFKSRLLPPLQISPTLFSERGAFFSARSARSKRRIYFLQKKKTVFSLFLKREGEALV